MKVNCRLLRSRKRVCRFKHPLTLEEAPAYLLAAQKDPTRYQNPEDLELYLCTECMLMHIGHKKGTKRHGEARG